MSGRRGSRRSAGGASRRRRRSSRKRNGRGARPGIVGRLAGVVALVMVGVTGIAVGIGIGTGTIGPYGSEAGGRAEEARDPAEIWTGANGELEVEVLNGGGISGMAATVTNRLRDAGFDVVYYGNAESFDEERRSVVIARAGNTGAARAVADTLGIDNVLSEPDPNLYVDVTVVVGREWTAPPVRTPDGAAGARRPWDPRTWFGG